MRLATIALAAMLLSPTAALAQKKVLSKSFELRYVTADSSANGETDFKGPTAYFNTNQRVEYLKHYSDFARKFFNDESLAHQVVGKQELDSAMKRLKPQPLPQVRQEIRLLDGWKWYGYKDGKDERASKRIAFWNSQEQGVGVKDGRLHFDSRSTLRLPITAQSWRYRFAWDNNTADTRLCFTNSSTGKVACEVGVQGNKPYYVCNGRKYEGKTLPGGMSSWLLEADLTGDNRRYNLKIDGKTVCDFGLLADTTCLSVDQLVIEGSKGTEIDNVWGVGYTKTKDTGRLNMPYYVSTFIDDDFDTIPGITNWAEADYNDGKWQGCGLPKAYGSERHEGEALYLRKKVALNDFDRVYFKLESLFPSGELWINGKVAKVIDTPHPLTVDITRFLKKNSENTLAIKINSFKAPQKQMMHHCPTDPNIGWFAGRASLILTEPTHVSDVYVYTRDIVDGKALVTAKVTVKNDQPDFYKGTLRILLKNWFPEEDKAETVVDSVKVQLVPRQGKCFRLDFTVDKAKLWCADAPNLYQVRALLANDESGQKTQHFQALDGDLSRSTTRNIARLTDDCVITTGFRVIDQDGGTFHVNRKPELLRAPLLFGQRFPLENLATDLLCASSNDLMKELLAIKKMNGNGVRMSVHWSDNYGQDGTNDPRLVEMGDQMGLMFIWTTASWIRVYSPFTTDYEGLGEYVRQVRNAPSIVIWQTSNHPDLSNWNKAMTYYHQIYDIIMPLDTMRLITPTADLRHMGPHNDDGTIDKNGKPDNYCDPIWTAPRIARGSMDYPTGFGQDWEYLRMWPHPRKWKGNVPIADFLHSKERAYFNFEQEESIGQMNWSLYKGSPVYKYHSYEWDYDKGSIGRLLTCDEWRESQAWQAFSAYECVRKMRWLDYDGMSWCCMWGGPNMGTYQKTLVDALGNKKVSFYANRMGFQNVLAGSHDVDMVYGPGDKPEIIVMNLGDELKASVSLTVSDINGKTVYRHTYKGVRLKAGRTVTVLGTLNFPKLPDGFYFFKYQVL